MTDSSILVLGIGNLLWADEGFGIRAVERLNERYRFPGHVRVMDGGTQGVYLLGHVQAARRMIVFDAVDYGLPPATLKEVWNADVPAFLGVKKMSLHQTGFQEVLACAELTGRCPEELVLLGVQPVELEDFGGGLRAATAAQLEPALTRALAILAGWGVVPVPRDAPVGADELTAPAGIDRQAYEAGRPSAETACRIGDARVLVRRGSA